MLCGISTNTLEPVGSNTSSLPAQVSVKPFSQEQIANGSFQPPNLSVSPNNIMQITPLMGEEEDGLPHVGSAPRKVSVGTGDFSIHDEIRVDRENTLNFMKTYSCHGCRWVWVKAVIRWKRGVVRNRIGDGVRRERSPIGNCFPGESCTTSNWSQEQESNNLFSEANGCSGKRPDCNGRKMFMSSPIHNLVNSASNQNADTEISNNQGSPASISNHRRSRLKSRAYSLFSNFSEFNGFISKLAAVNSEEKFSSKLVRSSVPSLGPLMKRRRSGSNIHANGILSRIVDPQRISALSKSNESLASSTLETQTSGPLSISSPKPSASVDSPKIPHSGGRRRSSGQRRNSLLDFMMLTRHAFTNVLPTVYFSTLVSIEHVATLLQQFSHCGISLKN